MTATQRNAAATQALIDWAQQTQANTPDAHTAAQHIVRKLGAHITDGVTEFGFWTPVLAKLDPPPQAIALELLHPATPFDLTAADQQVTFQRQHIPVEVTGETVWAAVDGLIPGTRDQFGTLYWLVYQTADGTWHTITDHQAYSVPFGVRAPAELIDMAGMFAARRDKDHFAQLTGEVEADGTLRLPPPMNILQIHTGTASPDGTLAGLTEVYQRIADKVLTGEDLTPAEQNYTAYDAVQLMPIEPPIEHEAGPLFWEEASADRSADTVTVMLRRHDIINWGYDVMISASPATNPSLLRTKRPHELLDLIETLHNFPGKPIRVMFDIVYGHTDNQALGLLNDEYLAGANMYGQNLNYLNPVVRASLIEMQRRKSNYGIDGIRVDGAQDFKWWNPETDEMIHDDDYLHLMNDIVQQVDGHEYRPWMIFEDGRPWPREDWELASTYREVTKIMPNVWQWGPLTFAHNTPFLFTFWISKWWRIQEMAAVGSHWITGCANHDTLRRGTQVPVDARMNSYLGATLPQIFENGYDNPAAKLFDYAMMPGIPMDFVNASMRAPWGFFRNTDDKYGVKVVSEEARFTEWVMTEDRFNRASMFPRLKAMGFAQLSDVRRFMHSLEHAVLAARGDLEAVAKLINSATPLFASGPFTVASLKGYALAWMEDVHEYCNIWGYTDDVSPARAAFNRTVREFRQARPWLMDNLRAGEHFDHQQPTNGAILFYGLRRSPDGTEQILFIANMEGAPRTVEPLKLPIPQLPQDGWRVSLQSPGLDVTDAATAVELKDSQGIVFIRLTT